MSSMPCQLMQGSVTEEDELGEVLERDFCPLVVVMLLLGSEDKHGPSDRLVTSAGQP